MDAPLVVPAPEPVEIARFEVSGEPATKGRARMYVRAGQVAVYTPERTRQAERAVIEAMVDQSPEAIAEDDQHEYAVTMQFVTPARTRRDVDNMAKLILDALNHRVWTDDAQVVLIRAEKVHGAPARTLVRIARVGLVDRPSRRCARCGAMFPMYNSWSDRKTCSRECAAEMARKPVTRHCWLCGVPVVMAPAESRRSKHANCTPEHVFGGGGRPRLEDTEGREYERERKAQRRIRKAVGDPVRPYTHPTGVSRTIAEGCILMLRERSQSTREMATRLGMAEASVRRVLNRDPSFCRDGRVWKFLEDAQLSLL